MYSAYIETSAYKIPQAYGETMMDISTIGPKELNKSIESVKRA